MLTLDQLRDPTDFDLASFDLAEVDLVCGAELPGAPSYRIPACLEWVDRAADWADNMTRGTIDQFHRDPSAYGHREEIFRVTMIVSVLQRGMGVRYNEDRIRSPEVWTDPCDDFIYGIILGRGGTCASLPVVFAAVGRRLGYPIRLVYGVKHQFCRWDDGSGQHLNIEINGMGWTDHPDEFYRRWPFPVGDQARYFEGSCFLQSLTPRQELAQTWAKRGYLWAAHDRMREAADCFATACTLAPEDQLQGWMLLKLLQDWRLALDRRSPPSIPRLTFRFLARRRFPTLPFEVERQIAANEVIEALLERPLPPVKELVCDIV